MQHVSALYRHSQCDEVASVLFTTIFLLLCIDLEPYVYTMFARIECYFKLFFTVNACFVLHTHPA